MNDEDWNETDVMRVGRKLGRTLYLSKVGEPEYPGKVIGIVDTRGLAEEICYRWNLQAEHDSQEELYYDTPRGAKRMETFSIDHMPPLEIFEDYKKKVTTKAYRIKGPFAVLTSEGVLTCQDGWLCIDARGYPYPVADDEFKLIYERVNE